MTRLISRLRRSERGALLVEFAILLPLLILILGVIVEGGRMMWSYQTAAAGVRDAARYLGRVVPSDSCTADAGGTALDGYEAELKTRIETSLGGTSVMPQMVTVQSVDVTRASCTTGYRVPQVAVVSVAATVRIQLPFKAMLEIVGGSMPAYIDTVITDRTRVFGA